MLINKNNRKRKCEVENMDFYGILSFKSFDKGDEMDMKRMKAK